MGFKSVMKKVGKVALKVAPIAAAFIPGVGPLASMGISAATNAASKKISGGSWKDALISGGVGAATGYGAGKLAQVVKGIGPSSYVKDSIANVANRAGGGGSSVFGNVIKGINAGTDVLGAVGGLRGSGGNQSDYSSGIGSTTNPTATARGGAMPKGGFRYSENPLNQYDQSSPNLSMALHQGRQEAIRNQPFRKGYDIKTLTGYENDDTTKPTYAYSSMPRIQSDRPDIRPRKKRNLDNSEVTTPESPVVRRGGGGGTRSRERVAAY